MLKELDESIEQFYEALYLVGWLRSVQPFSPLSILQLKTEYVHTLTHKYVYIFRERNREEGRERVIDLECMQQLVCCHLFEGNLLQLWAKQKGKHVFLQNNRPILSIHVVVESTYMSIHFGVYLSIYL